MDAGGVRGAPPPTTSASAPARYLALGDSFTIGTGTSPSEAFPARLVLRWRERGCAVDLENVAVNGYTTEDVIAEQLPAVARFKPTFVTIAVGANDIVRGTSLDVYRANVRRIFDVTVRSGARVVVLPQPDWSRSPGAQPFGTRESLDAKITSFNAALAEETRARGLTYVDLSPLMRAQAEKGMLASDGLHPAAEAHEAWAGELLRALPSPCGAAAPASSPRAP